MPTVFTMIIDGDLPGHFVYRDDVCVAFLSINPLADGHVLVVPIVEVDHWIDLDADISAHLFAVAQRLGKVLDGIYRPAKVALMIAGLEVPHTHLHIVPISGVHDLDFARAEASPDHARLADIATAIADAL